jgi:ribosomal protein L6P/L9E
MKIIKYKNYNITKINLKNLIFNKINKNIECILNESYKIKININKSQFYILSKNQYLIKKTYIRSFFSLLIQILNGLLFGFKLILRIKGKGIRIQFKSRKKLNLIRKLIYFKLGYSHKIFFKLPLNCWIKVFERRRALILYSLNYIDLKNLILKIRNFYPLGLYKLRGFVEPTEIIKIKKGKK